MTPTERIEDRRPSLSVSEGDDGQVLVTCHADCPADSIGQAVGLPVADVRTNDPSMVPAVTQFQLAPTPPDFLDYLQSGISVIPIKTDGSKSPVIPWKRFQSKLASEQEAREWAAKGYGIGIVCGTASCGLEVLDFDDREYFVPWYLETDLGFDDPQQSLPMVRTPNGWHVYYRCNEISGNEKIARCPDRGTLIESRGQGGYVVGPGSAANCHPSGRLYEQRYGRPITNGIPRIAPQQRAQLWAAAAKFDRTGILNQEAEQITRKRQATPQDATGTAWDDFNRRGNWFDILRPHGWTTRDGTHWTRPGKRDGVSAILRKTSDGESEVLVVFSANAGPLAPNGGHRTLSKFEAYKHLSHGGDGTQAARQLVQDGYGKC